MLSLQRIIFWVVAGACMGFGLIAFGLGLTPFFFGAVVALYGVKRFGPQGFWITLVSMGSVPMALVTVQYYTADPRTITYPINPLPTLALAFGPIILGGLIWSRIEQHRTNVTRTH
jgi:hypothetical protein